jgi:hypothetical protein
MAEPLRIRRHPRNMPPRSAGTPAAWTVPPWEYEPGTAPASSSHAQQDVPPWEYAPGAAPASNIRVQQDVPPWEYLPGEGPHRVVSTQHTAAGLVPPWEELPCVAVPSGRGR